MILNCYGVCLVVAYGQCTSILSPEKKNSNINNENYDDDCDD